MVRETGPSSVMKVEHDYPVPKLAPGGVLVANKYSGINFIDTYHRSGLYKRELPFIGGQEGGGFVAAVTPEAEAQGEGHPLLLAAELAKVANVMIR